MNVQATRPFAVVTGGSSGIGYELARQFAQNGYSVLIAAEDESHLADARAQLAATGAEIGTHASDLATEEGVDSLYRAIADRPVDVLCVNAGVGLGGPFADTDLQRELRMIDLNVRGAVQLTKLVLKGMVARDSGKLLFTSSIAATHPDSFEAVYGATKVFLRWFGEALRNELKDTGIGVTVLMPSVTETNFFERADMMDTNAGTMENKDDPAVVAKAGFDALMADKHKVVPTIKNKIMGALAGATPAPVGAQMHRALAEPGSGKED
jgi:short-subunit dehydrogenase